MKPLLVFRKLFDTIVGNFKLILKTLNVVYT